MESKGLPSSAKLKAHTAEKEKIASSFLPADCTRRDPITETRPPHTHTQDTVILIVFFSPQEKEDIPSGFCWVAGNNVCPLPITQFSSLGRIFQFNQHPILRHLKNFSSSIILYPPPLPKRRCGKNVVKTIEKQKGSVGLHLSRWSKVRDRRKEKRFLTSLQLPPDHPITKRGLLTCSSLPSLHQKLIIVR